MLDTSAPNAGGEDAAPLAGRLKQAGALLCSARAGATARSSTWTVEELARDVDLATLTEGSALGATAAAGSAAAA